MHLTILNGAGKPARKGDVIIRADKARSWSDINGDSGYPLYRMGDSKKVLMGDLRPKSYEKKDLAEEESNG
jgi:hypothetical protein